MLSKIILTFYFIAKLINGKENNFNFKDDTNFRDLDDHTLVTDNNVFPYVVAILKTSKYICAGALITDEWAITAADDLFFTKNSLRLFRVRLGSINYKKGGTLRPIKYVEIHPNFDDTKPDYDLALLKLASPVRFTPNLNPIRLQKRLKPVAVTHFIVTAWQPSTKSNTKALQNLESMELIKRRRILKVSHLHPTSSDKCIEALDSAVANHTGQLMCLDQALGSNPCMRETGAPVVLNGILWGLVSSWKPEDCDVDTEPSFVNLVATNDIASWIHAVIHGNKWHKKSNKSSLDYEYDTSKDY